MIDVSCDLGMGFPFARPTSFEDPVFEVGGGAPPAVYYGVDHTPSYLWDAATWEISEGLLPYLPAVMEGPVGWERTPALARAIALSPDIVLYDEPTTGLHFQDIKMLLAVLQRLVDGGVTTPPQFGIYGLASGDWLIEGWGVEPHQVVMNMPADVVAGRDAQLEAGVAYLLEQLERHGERWAIPPVPAYPDKSRPRMSGVNR